MTETAATVRVREPVLQFAAPGYKTYQWRVPIGVDGMAPVVGMELLVQARTAQEAARLAVEWLRDRRLEVLGWRVAPAE